MKLRSVDTYMNLKKNNPENEEIDVKLKTVLDDIEDNCDDQLELFLDDDECCINYDDNCEDYINIDMDEEEK